MPRPRLRKRHAALLDLRRLLPSPTPGPAFLEREARPPPALRHLFTRRRSLAGLGPPPRAAHWRRERETGANWPVEAEAEAKSRRWRWRRR